jgi:hypothetical protein
MTYGIVSLIINTTRNNHSLQRRRLRSGCQDRMVNNPYRINDFFLEVRFARSKRGCDADYSIDCLGKIIEGVGSAEVGDLDEDGCGESILA